MRKLLPFFLLPVLVAAQDLNSVQNSLSMVMAEIRNLSSSLSDVESRVRATENNLQRPASGGGDREEIRRLEYRLDRIEKMVSELAAREREKPSPAVARPAPADKKQ